MISLFQLFASIFRLTFCIVILVPVSLSIEDSCKLSSLRDGEYSFKNVTLVGLYSKKKLNTVILSWMLATRDSSIVRIETNLRQYGPVFAFRNFQEELK